MARNNANRVSQRNYYSRASEAYKVHPDYERQIKRTPNRRKKVNRGVKYRYEAGENNHSLYIYFVIAIMFVASLLIIFIVTAISDKQSSINTLQTDVRRVQQDNAALSAELSRRLDLGEIEQIARLRLGMRPPENHQIVRIHVESATHMIQNGVLETMPEETKREITLLDILKDIFLK